MTICSAAITSEGIVIISDCRVTYEGSYLDPFSDSLLKTVPLADHSTLSFAGDIYCAQFVVARLNPMQITDAAKKGGYYLLRQVARQLSHAYREFSKKARRNCYVSFLLTACTQNRYWIGTCESPEFKLAASDSSFSAFSIGDTPATRRAVTTSVQRALESDFEGFNLAMLIASSVESTLQLLYPDKYLDDHKEHSVSSLFTIFRLDWASRVSVVPYAVDMFRGRIADRNKPLGCARVNEVIFRPDANKFFLVNHQTGKSNVLSDITSFRSQHRGVIETKFNPYELQG